jgi:DNA invertase Pin-like site-specific DNA recombinase
MNNHKPKTGALYLRISTDKQATDMQRQICADYALQENIPVIQQINDTASGALPWRERQLADLLKAGSNITDILIYEYSRIGRDMVDTLDFLKTCNEKSINVHITKTKTIVRGDLGGKVLSTVMSLAAEIERDLLRSRTKDALAERKRQIKNGGGFTSKAGKFITKLGRPAGATAPNKLEKNRGEIEELFAANVADAAIARIYKVDRRTVANLRNAKPKAKP